MNYELIYCDPPWQYGNKASRGAAENHYPTMGMQEMCRLPVSDIAAKNTVMLKTSRWHAAAMQSRRRSLRP
jgi:N6-adenosine-specific RNA methylase IME4